MSELSLDWLISVDDHVLEPPDVWVSRVAAKDRDSAPHMGSTPMAWTTGSMTPSATRAPA